MTTTPAPTGRLSAIIYLHANRDAVFEKGVALGLSGEALKRFSFAGYEVKVGLVVDPATGDAIISTIDDRPVAVAGPLAAGSLRDIQRGHVTTVVHRGAHGIVRASLDVKPGIELWLVEFDAGSFAAVGKDLIAACESTPLAGASRDGVNQPVPPTGNNGVRFLRGIGGEAAPQ